MNTQRGFLKIIFIVIIVVILITIFTDWNPQLIWDKTMPILNFLWGIILKLISSVIDMTLWLLEKIGLKN